MSTMVAMLSGGLDSTVLLAHVLQQGHTVAALSVRYGQRHARELVAARSIAEHYGIEWCLIDLSPLRGLMLGSALTSDIPVPHGHYADPAQAATIVPNRNMVLLSLAGSWAIARKADAVAYGAHAGDHAVYPDCRPAFIDACREVLALSDVHQVGIETPFITWTKIDICRRADELRVPVALTYSCYEGGIAHCGRCGACVERREAFDQAKIADPTTYVL